jgi:DNA (cytosine-5)-methyltransferase 1
MIELKKFMRENGIADIYMRMLKVIELKRIQGFPDDYILTGPLDKQKKHIGNSVETGVVKAWLRAIAA